MLVSNEETSLALWPKLGKKSVSPRSSPWNVLSDEERGETAVFAGYFGLGYRKPRAIYHVKCYGRFLSSFWRNYGYFPWQIYLGKVWSHASRKFPAVKGSFTTVKASRVTAPIAGYYEPCKQVSKCLASLELCWVLEKKYDWESIHITMLEYLYNRNKMGKRHSVRFIKMYLNKRQRGNEAHAK